MLLGDLSREALVQFPEQWERREEGEKRGGGREWERRGEGEERGERRWGKERERREEGWKERERREGSCDHSVGIM